MDESRHREKMREWREKGRMEEERQREVVSGELGEDCHESGKRKEKMTGTKWEERGEEKEGERRGRWTEGERGGRNAALGERAG